MLTHRHRADTRIDQIVRGILQNIGGGLFLESSPGLFIESAEGLFTARCVSSFGLGLNGPLKQLNVALHVRKNRSVVGQLD
jgi:hypothetical protein